MARTRSKPASLRRKTALPAESPVTDGAERPLKIGEAARTIGVEAYVLRFWETQFPFLRPKHSRSKHRFYDQHDLETLRLIKRLLHGQGFTIAGAKKHIREAGLETLRDEAPRTSEVNGGNGDGEHAPGTLAPAGLQRTLVEIREDLRSLQRLLTD